MLPTAVINPLELKLAPTTLPTAVTTPVVERFPPLMVPVADTTPAVRRLPACTLPVADTKLPCTVPVVLTELVEPLVKTASPLTVSTLALVNDTGTEFMKIVAFETYKSFHCAVGLPKLNTLLAAGITLPVPVDSNKFTLALP